MPIVPPLPKGTEQLREQIQKLVDAGHAVLILRDDGQVLIRFAVGGGTFAVTEDGLREIE